MKLRLVLMFGLFTFLSASSTLAIDSNASNFYYVPKPSGVLWEKLRNHFRITEKDLGNNTVVVTLPLGWKVSEVDNVYYISDDRNVKLGHLTRHQEYNLFYEKEINQVIQRARNLKP
ncbi:MAG TPA: hypothetical protein VEL47_05930 [Myxococcota bacterium]|nr:hypothetical protein [Myxococcota bacterium]